MTARAHVDLGAVTRNVARLMARAPTAAACAVVKADGYGHGVLPVARAALEGGATWLAVATPAEAAAIAAGGIDPAVPVLLLSEVDPDALADAWDGRPAALRCTVASVEGAAALERLGRGGPPIPVHLKIDTGMHRMGADPADAVAVATAIAGSPQLELEGVWTHFAVADDPANGFTAEQIARFDSARAELGASGHRPAVQHLCNSAGAIAHPAAHRDLVRLGIAMYGVAPSPALSGALEIEPALRLTANVTALRTIATGEGVSYGRRFIAAEPTRVATIDIGYADGIRRSSPSCGVEVLVRGRRAPMLGVVTMDQTMLAVGGDVSLGDEVVLVGTDGAETISAEEVGGRLGTIGYEVLTDLGPRVRRSYQS